MVDTALNGAYLTLGRGKRGAAESRKGTVVTQGDLQKHRKEFLLLSALYPALWIMAKLDGLLWFQAGYKLIVRARYLPPE